MKTSFEYMASTQPIEQLAINAGQKKFSLALGEAVAANLLKRREAEECGKRVTKGNFFLDMARAIDPYLSQFELIDITPDLLKAFRKFRLKSVSRSTVNKNMQVVRAALREAVKKGWVATNAAQGIRDMEINDAERRKFFEPEELRRLWAACASSANRDLLDIVTVDPNTGIDKGEILLLRKASARIPTEPWADLVKDVIMLPGYKTRPPREVGINSVVRTILIKRLDNFGDYFFQNPQTGKPYNDIKRAWATACRQAGVKMPFKALRHTFATGLVDAGTPIYEIQRLMGHKDPKTTAIYAQLPRSKNLQAVESLNKIFNVTVENPDEIYKKLF